MHKLIPIITNEKELLKPCDNVLIEDGKVIASLLEEQLALRADTAVGLAAPQIGINARVFAMKTNKGIISFINPIIADKQDLRVFMNEGCLSYPGRRINTLRYTKIRIIDALNISLILENFAAIVAQHEMDHIDCKNMFYHEYKNVNEKVFQKNQEV